MTWGRLAARRTGVARARLVIVLLGALLLLSVGAGRAVAAPPPAPTPTPLAPADAASVVVPFAISWSQVLDPAASNGGYNWEVSPVADFSRWVARDSTAPGTTRATVSGLVNGTYFWRVQAVNATVETGPWSAARTVTVTGIGPGQPGTPTLDQPRGGTQFHPWEAITWTWSAVPDAASYMAEWSTDPSFPVGTSAYMALGNIPGTTDGMAFGDSLQGTWFMRVRAVNADGVAGMASNVISFSVLYGNPVGPPPALIAPTGNPTLTLPITLSWTDGYNPQDLGYEVQISSSSSFSTVEEPTGGHTEPRRVVTSLGAGQKFWRVRSHQGNASPTTAAVTDWSATGSFTVSSAPPVVGAISMTRDPLYSGAEQRGQIQLTGPAPSGGAVVTLSSSDPSALPVPATRTIPAGLAVDGFVLRAGQVSAPTPVTVTATYAGASASTTITVMPPTLNDVILQPVVKATGGATVAGWVDLEGGGLAPAGGVAVSLESDSAAASVPATVTIPAGAGGTGFSIRTSPVTSVTSPTITARQGGVTSRWQITLTPAPPPDALTLRPSSTTGASQGIVTILLSAIAGHDQLLRVTSSNPGIATVPEFVTVPASTELGRFDIATSSVLSPTAVTISVSGGGVTRSAELTVHPSLPMLTGLSVSPSSVAGGTAATGTVTLSSGAPVGGVTVDLGSNQPAAAGVPPTVAVPAGATSASFTVTTAPVATTTVQLSATLDGSTRFAALTVTRTPALSALSVAPSTVTGGVSATGTVTLSAAAPSGGAAVTLADDSAAAGVPAGVTVAAGATSATFPVTTSAVTTSTAVTITGSSGGTSATATLTVNPPAPAAPALVSPAADARPAQPVAFDWSDVAGGASYEIQIDDTSTISAPFRASRIVIASQASIGDLPAQRLWWRVRARNSAGVFGPFSSTRRFEPQASTSTTPSLSSVGVAPSTVTGGVSATGTVTLSAAAPSGGAAVTLGDDSAAAGVPAGVTVSAGATSATFPVTTSAVTASTVVTLTATWGGVSRTTSLTVNPATSGALPAPSLVSPAADARFAPGQTITFDWADVAGAAGYTIQIDDQEAFSSPVATGTVSASTYATGTLPTTRMWWRARASDAGGAPGAWSAVRRVEVKG